ncbi:DUF438 domain-containing protein [candidate division KSB1 bacterium]|nr:DUF438 domain-containing protein [candidate division KSB1 bacterium]
MSELIDNATKRKDLLKHLILQIHQGQAPEAVRKQLIRLLGQVPYHEVVEVEQTLIQEGLPAEEVIKLCDLHSAALKGVIDQSGAVVAPPGHPVHTFREENLALAREINLLTQLYQQVTARQPETSVTDLVTEIRTHFNALMDVEKHYQRKEHLLFPFLEKHGVTGPPKVMWGKHDATRELLKGAQETLNAATDLTASEARSVIEIVLQPATTAIDEMITKEQEILFPMALDTLTETEWFEIYQQSPEIGFCLYDPPTPWQPTHVEPDRELVQAEGRIQLPSGSLNVAELTALLNTIPFDLTLVDAGDTVRFFTQGKERIFTRSRAILGRKVQYCHPPASVHIVEKILNDFKSGQQDQAAFWINLGGRFIHIEYFALRDSAGKYLGTLEVSQDLTAKRALQGEQRLLNYAKEEPGRESK